ncbi:TauD/TfdA family dioxygenase [Nocardia arizonensis]|uniref:TauD/TfdA family dioxygenase n=1 Tax=Nocardia arizonensis TaxID=1141647 RepID=UPI0006D0CA0E|nr:TauD/TfdA family dioxygenase [Nocardia arizonensis]
MNESPDDVLAQMVGECRKSGWASAVMPLHYVKIFAREHGWEPVATRRGDSPVSRLKPTETNAANPRSISAVTGLDEQLLHVDGSHLHAVPDLVVMHTSAPSSTPTRIWKPGFNVRHSNAVRHGVFFVGSGRQTFLATAVDDRGLRFDPYCMIPGDKRARDAWTALTTYGDIHEHRWDVPNSLLFVDNRAVLHGRAKASADQDRELTRVAYQTGTFK